MNLSKISIIIILSMSTKTLTVQVSPPGNVEDGGRDEVLRRSQIKIPKPKRIIIFSPIETTMI